MKNMLLGGISALILAVCYALFYHIPLFENTFASFGTDIPAISILVLDLNAYAWHILVPIAVFSSLLLLFDKIPSALCLLLPTLLLVFLLLGLYLPIMSIGKTI